MEHPMSRTVTLAGFVVLVALMLAYQAHGLVRRTTPTFGDAIAAISRTRAGRPLLLAAWLWLGWHLFVRGAYL
jgi:hypothetical protein